MSVKLIIYVMIMLLALMWMAAMNVFVMMALWAVEKTAQVHTCDGVLNLLLCIGMASISNILCHAIIDIDECLEEGLNDCHLNATCHNIVGSFYCVCSAGFEGTGVECDSKQPK